MYQLVLISAVILSSFSFSKSQLKSTGLSQKEETLRVPNKDVEGFYRTYDDFLNDRITDTVKFFLENNPIAGKNKLFQVVTKPNGKTKFVRVDLTDTTYWGASIRQLLPGASHNYYDFRIYDNKALEILLAGDIWMYSTGGLHATKKLNKPGEGLQVSHQLYYETAEDGHKEMSYFQKGLSGELVQYRGMSKSVALKIFEDCKTVYDSFDASPFEGMFKRVKLLYKHIDMYNHCKD